jgi:hypothetical protein
MESITAAINQDSALPQYTTVLSLRHHAFTQLPNQPLSQDNDHLASPLPIIDNAPSYWSGRRFVHNRALLNETESRGWNSLNFIITTTKNIQLSTSTQKNKSTEIVASFKI